MSLASELIASLNQEFALIRKEYTMFINGATKIEPMELRDKMLMQMKRLRNLSNLKTAEQFKADALVSKIQSHFSLWDRQVQNMDQKTVRRRAAVQKTARPMQVVISDLEEDRDALVNLYDEFTKQNIANGTVDQVSFAKFSAFIEKQTNAVKHKKEAKAVMYDVINHGGKVKIRSKSIK